MVNEDIDVLIGRCLSGEATQEEQLSLVKWLEESESNLDSFLEIKNVWDLCSPDKDITLPFKKLAEIGPDLVTEDKPISAAAERKKSFSNILGRILNAYRNVSAFILLPVFLLMFLPTLSNGNADTACNEVSTPYGTKSRIVLPDSSVVWLNGGSSISYPLDIADAGKREVSIKGEAFFEVRSDKEHPFIVRTSNITVTATGTKFNVNCYDKSGKETVALLDGMINVQAGKMENRLKPNQTAVYDKANEGLQTHFTNVSSQCGWIDGKLIFQNDRLSDIFKRLEEIYNIDFEVDKSVADCVCYATFENDSLDRILYLLSLVAPISYQWEENTLVRIRHS